MGKGEVKQPMPQKQKYKLLLDITMNYLPTKQTTIAEIDKFLEIQDWKRKK